MVRVRPAAVVTTGGYVAIPVMSAAAALGVPTLLWEGNVVPGRSTRTTARLASAAAVAFEATCARLAGACYVTGTPTRPAVLDRAVARARLGIDRDARCLLIFGGSQSVRRFDAAVDEALPELVRSVHVIHLTGPTAYPAAVQRRESLPAADRPRYRPYAFLDAEMAEALASADLVVGRAGSSTLAEVTALGLPMVVVPYPHAAGHQLANARVLADAGAALLVEDEAFDGTALLRAVELLDDPTRLEAMRSASRRLGRPGAADAVAELVLALAERRPLPSAETVTRIATGPA